MSNDKRMTTERIAELRALDGEDGAKSYELTAALNEALDALESAEARAAGLKSQLENVLDASKEGAWMARALDAEARAAEGARDTELLRALGKRLLVLGYRPDVDGPPTRAVNERALALAKESK